MINLSRIFEKATKATICFSLVTGFVLVQIKPFWIDEWRIIYNLKFKDAQGLWGPLDYMQQFPRAYLELLKMVTCPFDYSYFILRLPSFLAAAGTAILSYRLANRIYAKENYARFLFPAIIISCYTFTEYFIQVKQYTMDILLAVVAIWQLLEVLRLSAHMLPFRRYLWLCLSFLILPFFSYTYPIAIAPVFILVPFNIITQHNRDQLPERQWAALIWKLTPLLLCGIGIATFYITDVSQLMHDENMYRFWQTNLLTENDDSQKFAANLYGTFSNAGSGLLFECLLGVMGILGFCAALIYCVRKFAKWLWHPDSTVLAYSLLLLILAVLLFSIGALPLGEKRLTVFLIPPVAVFIIFCITNVVNIVLGRYNVAFILPVIIYAGVLGNVYTSFIGIFLDKDYARRVTIYKETEDAVIIANNLHLPIVVTPLVAFPYDETLDLPFSTTVPGDWVLKTYPAFKARYNISVYPAHNSEAVDEVIAGLSTKIDSVMIIEGDRYKIARR